MISKIMIILTLFVFMINPLEVSDTGGYGAYD